MKSKKSYYVFRNYLTSQVAPVVNNPPANAEDARDMTLIPGWKSSA